MRGTSVTDSAALCLGQPLQTPVRLVFSYMVHTIARYARTLRHLKMSQIVYRLLDKRPRRLPPDAETPKQRAAIGHAAAFPTVEPLRQADGRYVFLNIAGPLSNAGDWHHSEHGLLWLFNAHYFDDLRALDADCRYKEHLEWLHGWVQANPIGEGVGWHPYPTSLRIVNWVKWMIRFGADDVLRNSLALQARWLIMRLEFHLLGNHLFANAKALIFAGLFFEGDEAEAWLARGRAIFEAQLAEQFLSDGGHFERSPMYHNLMLEDLLDLWNLGRRYRQPIDPALAQAISRGVFWSRAMRHPDGGVVFFNDANLSGAVPPARLDRYALDLGFEEAGQATGPESVLLSDSGFVRLAADRAVAFMDVGAIAPDYLPGHAHAETLALELSLFGQRVLVNSGVGEYGRSAGRLEQRGTAAHNTVRIAGENSSEVWSGFRVGRRARILNLKCRLEDGEIAAAHDGYRFLSGRPCHRRSMQLVDGSLTVCDQITNRRGGHAVEVFWHLHPDIEIRRTSLPATFEFDLAGRTVVLTVTGDIALETRIESGSWCPRFGEFVTTRCLVVWGRAHRLARVVTRLQWSAAAGV